MPTGTRTWEQNALVGGVALLLAGMGALLILRASPTLTLSVVGLIVLITISFLHTELALHIVLLSMLISPEVVVGGGGVAVTKVATKGGAAVLRLEDVILLVVGFTWLAKTAIFKEVGLFLKTPLNKPILAYILSAALSTLLGVWGERVRPLAGFLFVLKFAEYFFVYFMAVNNLRDDRQMRRLLFTAFLTCAIVSLVAIGEIPSGNRVSAPFEGEVGEPNTFAGYLVFMMGISLSLFLHSPVERHKWGWFLLSGLFFLPFLYTLSRTGWIAFLVMFVVLTFTSPRGILLPGIATVGLLLGLLFSPVSVVERIDYTINPKPEAGQFQVGNVRLDTSTSARLASWSLGLTGWMKQPLLGHGVTGFAFMDAQYVRVLVEMGLVGFAAFLWLLWSLFRETRRIGESVPPGFHRGLVQGYLAGFIALLVHGFGANSFIIVRIMEPFWFLTGVVLMLPHLKREEEAPALPPEAGAVLRRISSGVVR